MGRQYKVRTHKGKQTKYIYGRTRKVVTVKLARAIADRESGIVVDVGSLQTGDYLDDWLDSVRNTVKHRIWQRHEEVVRLHLKPSLGKIRLNGLDALRYSLYIGRS